MRNLIRKLLSLCLVAMLMLLASSSLFAQAISGDVTGTVKDASGAMVTSATVEAVNVSTGFKTVVPTSELGQYHFTNLPIGRYRISATGAGLTANAQEVDVVLNRVITVNLTMVVSASDTKVEVIAQAASVDTTTSTIQTNYEVRQTQDLPMSSVGLGVLNLSLLQAGVASSGGVGAGTGPSVGGQRPRNNNYTIEGVDNNDKSVTGPLLSLPNDSVANFTVLQNNFSPEFGHSSGGQFNTVVMSGGNAFHGRAYEYFRNRNLNGQDAQVAKAQRNQVGVPVQNTRYDNNRFGGQIGGPIIKDKLFFFSNNEYQPIGSALSASACAPLSGGYATLDAMAAAGTISKTNYTIMKQYLPVAGGAPGPNSACPSSAVVNGVTIPVGDIGFTGSQFSNTFTTVNSIDLNATAKDQLRFRYIFQRNTAFDTSASLPAFWQGEPYRYHVITFSEFHTFNPKLLNEFRMGFNRSWYDNKVGSQQFPGLASFPNITIDEFNGVNIGPGPNAPQWGFQNTYQMVDNISWAKGNHNMKFGFEVRKYIAPSHFVQRERGDYYWTTLDGYLNDLGPDDFGERSTGNANYIADQYAYYAYGNDEWKLNTHLTLNLGLRYEYTSNPYGLNNQSLNSAASVPGLISFEKPKTQKKNFAPRVGFAYSPGSSGDTSIRGGFAMAYDVLYDNLGTLSLPPQLSATCDYGTAQNSYCHWSETGFLANGGLPQQQPVFTSVLDQRQATSSYVPDQKLPYSMSWNFGVQHVFAKTYIAEVRYVGTRGIRLPVQTRLNIRSLVNSNQYLPTFFGSAPTQAQLDALKFAAGCSEGGCATGVTDLFNESNYVPEWEAAGFNGSAVVGFMPYGKSIYHGLQTQLTRNMTKGIQFQAAWTWSHIFDNSTADVFSTLLTPRRPQDFQNINADMAASALDRRHRVTLQVLYDVQQFKNDKNWFKKNVLGNWEIAPVWTFQTGEYATVQSAMDANLNGDSWGDRVIINPQGVKGTGTDVTALTNSNGDVVAYMAAKNAYYVRAGYGALANAPRNTLAMPRTNNWDLTVVKRFALKEEMSFEFQAQALNLFNHSQYVPGYLNDVRSLGYTGGAERDMLTPGKATFNRPDTVFSQNPRSMQLVLKFIF